MKKSTDKIYGDVLNTIEWPLTSRLGEAAFRRIKTWECMAVTYACLTLHYFSTLYSSTSPPKKHQRLSAWSHKKCPSYKDVSHD